MIVAGSASPLLLASAAGGGYNLTNSLRFRSSASAYLNRTPASAGNRTTWTFSAWIKRGSLSGTRNLFSAKTGTTTEDVIFFNGDSALDFYIFDGSFVGRLNTTAVYRDPSSWYHVVSVWDTTQATDTNRMKLYVNGVQVTAFSTATYPSQNAVSDINNNANHFIAKLDANYFDGYLAETHFIDGQALTPSSFGEYNSKTGVWQPIEYASTYGTNGFYLPFTDNSALTTSSNVGLGKDFSGNGNYWTTNNISITAGADYDSMKDVPTLTSATAANFCSWNPLNMTTVSTTTTEANLRFFNLLAGAWRAVSGTIAPTSGKYYWECFATSTSSGYMIVGVLNPNNIFLTTTASATFWDFSTGYGYYGNSGNKLNNGASESYGSTFTNADIIGVALDLDNGKIFFSKNGTWQASGDPAAGTNPAYSGIVGPLVPTVALVEGGASATANFGQRPFTYTPPTGFKALNTFNLPTPTIGATASTQANKYFDATTYTGNGTDNRAVTGLGFQPDFTWIKSRSETYSNILTDAVRGTDKILLSNSVLTEFTNTNYLKTFTSDGFTLGTDGAVNGSGATLVGWSWKANGTGITNTAGTITSTVSANTSAGFSVVTYSGNSTAGATVGHGLGVAPSMVIIKYRNSSSYQWYVYQVTQGATKFFEGLSSNAAVKTGSAMMNNTSPTSTVFSLGDWGGVNETGGNYVAYCWSEIAGYSKFGSYVGNASTDGTFVYTGFRPRYIMIKNSSIEQNWNIYDVSRSPYNVAQSTLSANQSGAEFTDPIVGIDILSNGFKPRTSDTGLNGNGNTLIYMAFAENPYKYSLAR